MKIKIANRLEWFLSPVRIESIKQYSKEKSHIDMDRCSLYPQSMIPRQLGHE